MKYWVGFLTFLVALLGIGYLNLYCCNMEFNSNSAGVIISALGVLVTLLVGWQIYKSIEYGLLVRRMDDMEHIAEGYMQFAVGMTRLAGNPEDTLLHCIIALEHLNAATHAKYQTIFDVLEVLSELPINTLKESDKRRLLSALRKTNEPHAEELADKFKNWPTNS